jgi:hypothetical protein
MLTNQQIFDRVYVHLLRQNAKSQEVLGGITTCLYRSPEGLSCAVGCLISDEFYSPAIENSSVLELLYPTLGDGNEVLRRTLEGSGIDLESSGQLLNRLQRVHDGFDPANWSKALEVVAEEFGLTLPEMPETK